MRNPLNNTTNLEMLIFYLKKLIGGTLGSETRDAEGAGDNVQGISVVEHWLSPGVQKQAVGRQQRIRQADGWETSASIK